MDPNYYQNPQYYQENPQNFYVNSEAVIYQPEKTTYDTNLQPNQLQQYWAIPQTKINSELITKAREFRNNKLHETDTKNDTVVQRFAAGKVWRDDTLSEWPENDYRIFVGDLGNDATEEDLKEAFGKYPSFAKCKLIRNKRTMKSKGFGFK